MLLEDGYFRENPAEKIKCKFHPNNEVRKAAVCSLYNGFRWCDIEPLT
jgi:integrase